MRASRIGRGVFIRLKARWQLTVLISVLLLVVPQVVRADEALTQSFSAEGNYAIAAAGVGLFGPLNLSGDITLDIPGTPIQAYLYWAANDGDPGGDDTITLSINAGPPISITADRVNGPDFWFSSTPDVFNYVYAEDVTSLVLSGSNTYTISDFGPIRQKYGAGLVVVYQDLSLPTSLVEIVDGLDSAYWNFPPPRGPNSEVVCFQFAAAGISRGLDFTIVAGGITIVAFRPDAIWYLTGSGTLPGDVIGQPGAVEIGGQPLNSNDANQWDTYNDSITVPAGDTFACFQVESVSDEPPFDGASLIWFASAFSISVPTPTPTVTPSTTPTIVSTATPDMTPTPTATIEPAPTSAATPLGLPQTGFKPWGITTLPSRPASSRYTVMGDLSLEVPDLGIKIPILGVPIQGDEWDVTWLSNQAGYLEGSAFPTFSGNTALTSHVHLADGSPGPFFRLGELRWGDEIILHAFGQRYVYEVRQVETVRPNDLSVLRHEELDWITLITCSGYDWQQEAYSSRLAVRAVRLKVTSPEGG